MLQVECHFNQTSNDLKCVECIIAEKKTFAGLNSMTHDTLSCTIF